MDPQITQRIEQRKISQLLKESEDIVISGMGGRFPLSNSVDEFAQNLYDNVDMITPDENEERWPKSKSNSFLFTQLVIQLINRV